MPQIKSLHISLKTAHSGCKPSSFMSSLTHCSHVFLLRPRPLVPFTTNPLQADTQSSTLLRSRCPNHLNLPRLTTSATQLIPRRLYKSSLRFLSFKDTPHIHLTIIRSVLSRLLRSSAFIAHVSVPYIRTRENEFWERTVHEQKSDSKKLWRTVSTVLGKSTGKSTTPPFSPAEFLSFLQSKVETIRSATSSAPPPVFIQTDSNLDSVGLMRYPRSSKLLLRRVVISIRHLHSLSRNASTCCYPTSHDYAMSRSKVAVYHYRRRMQW